MRWVSPCLRRVVPARGLARTVDREGRRLEAGGGLGARQLQSVTPFAGHRRTFEPPQRFAPNASFETCNPPW